MYTITRQEKFNEVECNFYKKENNEEEIFMTAEQLGKALGYLNPTKSISNLVNRNPKLKTEKFSVVIKLVSTDGKSYNTRLFNEDGIYEVTFLSDTEKAEIFRDWVREILKVLRVKKIIPTDNKIINMIESINLRLDKLEENSKSLGWYIDTLKSYMIEEITENVENKFTMKSIDEKLNEILVEMKKNSLMRKHGG